MAKYVKKCLTCQQVKAEHQKPVGQLQPIQIPEWKWEEIAMAFIVGLPRQLMGMTLYGFSLIDSPSRLISFLLR